ncbi:hypothetical protein CVV26_02680 [Candidatus Kuenenbacteria bacterium HGW-Kuenenbacteria-1]|uniref:Glycosyltransferase RgtA/B/C/D-like domain-containing protein n=1 Tax=Candidatus Kuenenbacteria bacterium HGW-Kuenenbacteria-1 TaxID=2013812 RepID=A0A2N1UN79_9BACT|nr:MAG: hypothetical protein CVV26_02680 [Candidatus Kuenenbacteria bacterium HGW-Kuenenbacteria-1]
MKKINFTKIIWALFYIFVFCFLLSNSYKYLDPDLGWHLKVGEQIINEKAIPTFDHYNWTLEGKQWVDHEWLMNVITFWIYDNFGYFSINIFFVLIALTVLIILNLFTQKYFLKEKNALLFILIFQYLGLKAMAPHLGIRIQEITLLNLLLLLIIIYNYEKNKNYKILFWLLPLFYLWACFHAGFLIGIFIMFFWLAVKIIEIIIAKYKIAQFIDLKNKLNLKNIYTFFSFTILGILTTFFTPYGLKLYNFLGGYSNSFYMTHIQEWLPFYSLPIIYWQLLYTAFVATVILLLIIDAIKKEKKIDLWQTLLSLFFIILALKSKRHFPLLFIVSFPMVIIFFTNLFNLKKIFKKLPHHLLLSKTYLIIAFLLIIISQFIKVNFTSDPFLSFNNDYPQKAIIFLKNNPQYDNLKLFNPYGWGGYLIWTLPERKLFIDGRLPQYKFAKHTFLEEYYDFFNKEKTKNKLDKYNIQLVLLDIKEKKYHLNWFEKYFLDFNEEEINKNANKNQVKDYLNNSNEWEKVYNDEISNIYVKK